MGRGRKAIDLHIGNWDVPLFAMCCNCGGEYRFNRRQFHEDWTSGKTGGFEYPNDLLNSRKCVQCRRAVGDTSRRRVKVSEEVVSKVLDVEPNNEEPLTLTAAELRTGVIIGCLYNGHYFRLKLSPSGVTPYWVFNTSDEVWDLNNRICLKSNVDHGLSLDDDLYRKRLLLKWEDVSAYSIEDAVLAFGFYKAGGPSADFSEEGEMDAKPFGNLVDDVKNGQYSGTKVLEEV